ncbi:hypothetical protein M413DRAFT_443320, partial [Hebeloma cylindrosporum]
MADGVANRKPPTLSMSFASESHRARRPSTTSSAGSDSDGPGSPISALDSSAALILVHDQDEPPSPLDFTDDEDDREEDDLISPIFEVRQSAVFPPLPPTTVFLYLLAPYLRLGALDLPNSSLPLKFGLPALLLSALASAFARQIWYMLARYLRKADMTEVLLDTFAKGRGKERQRAFIRVVVRIGTGTVSTLVAITYLRHSMYSLHPLLSWKHHSDLSYAISTLVVSVLVAYLSYARSLNSRRIVYITWLSIATYIAWLGCTIYAHTHGLLETHSNWLGAGFIWQGIASTAFAFCSNSTLPLYASLKSTSRPISTAKVPRSRPFRMLSLLSVATAILFLLPSVIFSAFPNHPTISSISQVPPPESTPTVIPSPTSTSISPTPSVDAIPVFNNIPSLSLPLPSQVTLPSVQLHSVRRILSSTTVILGIPSLIVTTPSLPIPSLRSVKFNVSRVLIIFIVILLSIIPPSTYPHDEKRRSESYLSSSGFFSVLTVIMLLMALISTYFVPAFVHIITHFFKRPLAIVVQPRTPLLHTPSPSGDMDNNNNNTGTSPRTIHDELLLRKERALQKKQFKKRIVWDTGVWVLLGASATGVVFIAGKFVGVW